MKCSFFRNISFSSILFSIFLVTACEQPSNELPFSTNASDSSSSDLNDQSCPLAGMSSDAHQFSSSINEESLGTWEFYAYTLPNQIDEVEIEMFDDQNSVWFMLEQKESDTDNDLWYRNISSPVEPLNEREVSVSFWFKFNGEVIDCSVNINHFSNTEE